MAIVVKNLSYTYLKGTPLAVAALNDVSFTIGDGEFVGLIGQTGSGKSTLIQHLNALIRPELGQISIDGVDLGARKVNLRAIREKVGLVFQYPEHQVFEETVAADVAFGPRNLGLSDAVVARRAREAIATVGLDYEALKDRSPYELSGGQLRLIAIAGVLAMQPRVLILDEPTAGLDPRGRDELLEKIKRMYDELGITVILVSHNMEEIARMVKRLIVMHKGRVVLDGPVREIFRQAELLREIGLATPQLAQLARRLRERGLNVDETVFTVEEARAEILRVWSGGLLHG
ncbi:MAG: energy-coupling factor transporter ATPase [Syntrophothermus sp.]